jgi:pimeloyl-ACP methyl ester carboxylesterase
MLVTPRRFVSLLPALVLVVPLAAAEPEAVRFPTPDGQTRDALVWAGGPHGVVLAHGGVFDKESWTPQAEAMAAAGLTVLAFDFRGYGEGEPEYGLPGKPNDVLGAIDCLAGRGHERISVVGGSMGGEAAIAAAAASDRIDLLVLLAPGGGDEAGEIRARSILVVTAEGDRLRATIDGIYSAAPEPKRIEILPGTAHAQHLFATDQGPAVTGLIVEFLATE